MEANDSKKKVAIELPHTVGMWRKTAPVVIELTKGKNVLRFSREGEVKGITIKDFTLAPTSRGVTLR